MELSTEKFVALEKRRKDLDDKRIRMEEQLKLKKEELAKVVALVKYKQPPVANADTVRAGVVVSRVQKGLGDPKVTRGGRQVARFNMSTHTRCWRHFKVRPTGGSAEPQKTDTQYCIYDKRHNDYGYTEAWVQFLIRELQKSGTWAAIERQGSSTPDDEQAAGSKGNA